MDFVPPAAKSQPPGARGRHPVSEAPLQGPGRIIGTRRVIQRAIHCLNVPCQPQELPFVSCSCTGNPGKAEPAQRRAEGVDQPRWWQDTFIYSLTKPVRRSCLACERGGKSHSPFSAPSCGAVTAQIWLCRGYLFPACSWFPQETGTSKSPKENT